MKNAEIITLRAPNCVGESPIKPFFISMKELPQIIERMTNIIHFLLLGRMFIKICTPQKALLVNKLQVQQNLFLRFCSLLKGVQKQIETNLRLVQV